MITTSVTWNITDLMRHDSDGFVYEIKYSITGISTETVGSASTTLEHVITGGYVVPDQTRTGSEVGFSSLTEGQIINWVKTGMGTTEVAMYEDIIPNHLNAMRNGSLNIPKDNALGEGTSSGLPWG
tara:strand:+ start:796 stop:1173 length:378 start_codon:yes stop_codon:yes gene_type:complete